MQYPGAMSAADPNSFELAPHALVEVGEFQYPSGGPRGHIAMAPIIGNDA